MGINNLNITSTNDISKLKEEIDGASLQNSLDTAGSVSGNVTDPASILEKARLPIINFKNALSELNEASLDFIEKYDEYNRKNLYDASLLKERMKDAVRKAVSEL